MELLYFKYKKGECKLSIEKIKFAKEKFLKALKEYNGEIINTISETPNINGVNVIDKNCCSVPFSAIASSENFKLSPFYWNVESQKGFLINLINQSKTDEYLKKFQEIVEKGYTTAEKKNREYFHPNIINVLKGLLNE